MNEPNHAERAVDLFREGYNCAQAVFAAFCDVTGMDFQTALRLSSSMGGGMGRLREVCGACTGMFLAAGLLYGYDDPADPAAKAMHYLRIQMLAAEFRSQHGTLICRQRPCARFVEDAARILDAYLEKEPPKNNLQ